MGTNGPLRAATETPGHVTEVVGSRRVMIVPDAPDDSLAYDVLLGKHSERHRQQPAFFVRLDTSGLRDLEVLLAGATPEELARLLDECDVAVTSAHAVLQLALAELLGRSTYSGTRTTDQ